MKIAVTSQNRATVSDHAGRCRSFWVYETEYADVREKHLVELGDGQGFHGNLPGPLAGINVLISGGMASALRYHLKQQGVQAVTTREGDPDRAVAAWLNGTLDEMPPHGHIGQVCEARP
jgi:predicted Fe-Mo cluster-binding NifX family protein